MSLYKGTTLISGAIPDMANQSLSNLNSAGQDLFDAKVNKSGDTMTGELNIDNAGLTIINPDVTKGTAPSTQTWQHVQFVDSVNSEFSTSRLGILEQSINTDGSTSIYLRTVQNRVNSTSQSSLQLNMTLAGVASCSFPNTTRCDGQFIPLWRDLISVDTSLNGSSELPYTIPEIENKGFFHMALITMTVNTGNVSGNYANGEIRSYMSNIVSILRVRTRTASTMTSSGSCWIPVGTDGKIYVNRNTNWNGSMSVLRCMGYRRIGYNENA